MHIYIYSNSNSNNSKHKNKIITIILIIIIIIMKNDNNNIVILITTIYSNDIILKICLSQNRTSHQTRGPKPGDFQPQRSACRCSRQPGPKEVLPTTTDGG